MTTKRTKTPGSGRTKGTPNKVTAEIKDIVLTALSMADKKGAVAYLIRVANENPAAFLGLLGKIIPLTVTGPNGGPIVVRHELTEAERSARVARLLDLAEKRL